MASFYIASALLRSSGWQGCDCWQPCSSSYNARASAIISRQAKPSCFILLSLLCLLSPFASTFDGRRRHLPQASPAMSLRELGLNVFLKQHGHFGSGQNVFTLQQELDVLVFKPGFGQGPAIARARRPIKSVVLRFQGMKQCSMLSVIIGEGSALIPSEVIDSASREQHVVQPLAEQKSLQGLVGMHGRDQPVFLTAVLHGGSGIFLPHDQVCQTGCGRLTVCLHPSRLEACQS